MNCPGQRLEAVPRLVGREKWHEESGHGRHHQHDDDECRLVRGQLSKCDCKGNRGHAAGNDLDPLCRGRDYAELFLKLLAASVEMRVSSA